MCVILCACHTDVFNVLIIDREDIIVRFWYYWLEKLWAERMRNMAQEGFGSVNSMTNELRSQSVIIQNVISCRCGVLEYLGRSCYKWWCVLLSVWSSNVDYDWRRYHWLVNLMVCKRSHRCLWYVYWRLLDVLVSHRRLLFPMCMHMRWHKTLFSGTFSPSSSSMLKIIPS